MQAQDVSKLAGNTFQGLPCSSETIDHGHQHRGCTRGAPGKAPPLERTPRAAVTPADAMDSSASSSACTTGGMSPRVLPQAASLLRR